MLTKDDLEQIQKLIEPLKQGQEQLRKEMQEGFREGNKKIEIVDRKVENVDLKVLAAHEFNKKAHTEIVDLLVESGEINYHELKKELKELKKRIEQIETKQQN